MGNSKETSAAQFWKSENARGFPNLVTIDGITVMLTGGADGVISIGTWLSDKGMIPTAGDMLDLAGGASTGYLFFGEDLSGRVYAADFSAVLLSENPLPEDKKTLLDIGTEDYPGDWGNRFGLIVMTYATRYLDRSQRNHVYKEAYRCLKPGGRLVMVDTTEVSRTLANELGEVAPYYPETESEAMRTVPYSEVRQETVPAAILDRRTNRWYEIDYQAVIGVR